MKEQNYFDCSQIGNCQELVVFDPMCRRPGLVAETLTRRNKKGHKANDLTRVN